MAPTAMRRLLLLAAACAVANGHGGHGRHAHDHADHHDHAGHDHAGHDHAGEDAHGDLHEHHEVINLTARTWDTLVSNDAHVWAVKFHSGMCGSCAAFAPAFESARAAVDGLHWAAVSIDEQENIALAKKLGVLQEGIPNVKLINAAELPLPIVSGDTPPAETLVAKLKETLQNAGASKDAEGYYKSHGRSEL